MVTSLMSRDRLRCWSPWFLRGKHSFNKSLDLSCLDYLEDFLSSETFSLFLAEAFIKRLAFMNAKIIQKLTLK